MGCKLICVFGFGVCNAWYPFPHFGRPFRSKIVEESDTATLATSSGSFRIKEMELTSQGAGTYWFVFPSFRGNTSE